jgi:hypothetical protein
VSPAGWVSGIVTYYAGFRLANDISNGHERDGTRRPLEAGGAVTAGFGWIGGHEDDLLKGRINLEVAYYLFSGWSTEDRENIGLWFESAFMMGPVGITLDVRYDAAIGFEMTAGPALFVGI